MNLSAKAAQIVHNLLSVVGWLLFVQGPIVNYTVQLQADQRIVSLIFSGLGLVAVGGKSFIDSRHDVGIAQATAAGVVTVPVSVDTTAGTPAPAPALASSSVPVGAAGPVVVPATVPAPPPARG